MAWRFRRPKPKQAHVWVVYVGKHGPDSLEIAFVTGTEQEADAALAAISPEAPSWSNMAETRPLNASGGSAVTNVTEIRLGERRKVHVLTSEDDWVEAFVSSETAQDVLRGCRDRGLMGAAVREVVTNTWLIDVETGRTSGQ